MLGFLQWLVASDGECDAVKETALHFSTWCTSSSSVFPAMSLGFTIFGEIFAYNHRGRHIPSSWIGVHLTLNPKITPEHMSTSNLQHTATVKHQTL